MLDVDGGVAVEEQDAASVYEKLTEDEGRAAQAASSNSPAKTAPAAPARSRSARLGNPSLAALDEERKFLDKRFGSSRPVHAVKQSNPHELLVLKDLVGVTGIALRAFLKRHGENPWMQEQHFYVQKAALAAAHMRMVVLELNGHWRAHRLSRFNGDDFLNCGWAKKTAQGTRYFFKCNQPEYCPSCNYHQRVIPARKEFLPAFGSAPLWYSVSAAATSDPESAGVKMFVGYDENRDEIYAPLVTLSELVKWPRLPKYDSQCWAAYMVAAGLWELMPWMIAGHYFDGLHVAGENKFTYYPDRRSPVGVSHTVSPHFHAYGNTTIPFDRRRALFLLKNAVQIMHRQGGGRLWAYPDIALRPIATEDGLKGAMDYVLKPWNFAEVYIEALARGCPVVGLNLEFQTTYFGSEHLLYPFPDSSGLSKWGARLGNMSEKAREHYIGDPLPRILNTAQVKRFLERLKRNEIWPWEAIRYERHLALKSKQDRCRAAQPQAQSMPEETDGSIPDVETI